MTQLVWAVFMNDFTELEALVSDVVVPLRLERTVDYQAVDKLVVQIRSLIDHYVGESSIPKRVAYLLHELMNSIEASIAGDVSLQTEAVGQVLVRFYELVGELYTT